MIYRMKLLVIEDDREASHYLSRGLKQHGHTVDCAFDGDSGLRAALEYAYDVLIVDRMLPNRDGLSIIQALRDRGDTTPALVLSALDGVDAKVEGLKRGSDDYLTKPYELNELIARVSALARRNTPQYSAAEIHVGDLTLNRVTHKVRRGGEAIRLQPREFRLLEYMMRHVGQIVTRTMLLENVWDYHFNPQTNVIDVQISRLRSKIDKGFEHSMLITVRGEGYRLDPPDTL